MSRTAWWLFVVLASCVGLVEDPDGGMSALVDGGANDGGAVDAGARDASVADAGALDAGFVDAGADDAGIGDAGSIDAGTNDAGMSDAGIDGGLRSDAGVDGGADAGPRDAGALDGGRIDAGGPFPDSGFTDAGYFFDFGTAPLEFPFSGGGVWTNNEQGTGGNGATGTLTSMRLGLASDGVTHIAMATHDGGGYLDSFAFVPGFPGNQFAEAVIYKAPGYDANAAGSNHEIELLLGCSSTNGTRTWNEFLVNSGGGVDILYLSGGPSDFQSIANVGGTFGLYPHDGDTIRATRIGNVLSLYLNGVLWTRYDGTNPALVARGDGIGIAAFVREGASNNSFGFRRITMGTLP